MYITVLGDQVVISEPEGNFSHEQFEAAATDEVVMLAAGTGKNTIVIGGFCSVLTKPVNE